MKENLNMDKIFRDKLDGFVEEPPAYVWDGIQSQMASRRRSKRIAIYSWVAVAAMLLLAFVAGWYFSQPAEETIPRIAEKESVKITNEVIPGEQKNVHPAPEENGAEEEKDPGALLATAPERKITKKMRGEKTVEPEGERENVLLALADLEYMERIESAEVKPAGKVETTSLETPKEVKNVSGLRAFENAILNENARDYARKTKEQAGWKMGVNISPGYSSYSASHGTTYASNMTYEASDGNSNLSGGLSVQYKANKRWSVESGVYYAQNGQRTGSSPQFYGGRAEASFAPGADEKSYYFNTAVNIANNSLAMNSTAGVIELEAVPKGAEIAANLETAGTYSNSLLTKGELSQVFDFVEIPLYLRYLLIDSKMDVEVVGGVNAGLVVGNNAYIDNEYGEQNIGKTRDISTVNVSGTLGVGVTYALSKHISVAVEPRLNYYLNSINRNAEVNFRPYRVGVYTGLYYEF